MLAEGHVDMEVPLGDLVDAATQSEQHDVVLPAGLQFREQPLRALVDGHDVGEERLPVLGTQHGRVHEGAVVHKVPSQQVQGLQVTGLRRDDLELGLLQTALPTGQGGWNEKVRS